MRIRESGMPEESMGSQFFDPVRILKTMGLNSDEPSSFIGSLVSNSDVVIAATNDQKLNEEIAIEARKRKILVCVVDKPSIIDFYVPATTRFGKIRVVISTGGRSPAMARILRKKLEEAITSEEVLQVELQHYARKLAKVHMLDKKLVGAFSIKLFIILTLNVY